MCVCYYPRLSQCQGDFLDCFEQTIGYCPASLSLSLFYYCLVGGVKFPQGVGSAVIHRNKKNYLLYKDATCLCCSHRLRLFELICNRKRAVNSLRIPKRLSTLFCLWSELPSWGGIRDDSSPSEEIPVPQKNASSLCCWASGAALKITEHPRPPSWSTERKHSETQNT